MSATERDLAETIYAEIISLKSAEQALDLWQHRRIGSNDLADMWNVLAIISEAAIQTVLARRQREAARTRPWNADLVDRIKRGEPADPVTETMAQVYATDWDTADDDQRIWWRLKSLQVQEALAARTGPWEGTP